MLLVRELCQLRPVHSPGQKTAPERGLQVVKLSDRNVPAVCWALWTQDPVTTQAATAVPTQCWDIQG